MRRCIRESSARHHLLYALRVANFRWLDQLHIRFSRTNFLEVSIPGVLENSLLFDVRELSLYRRAEAGSITVRSTQEQNSLVIDDWVQRIYNSISEQPSIGWELKSSEPIRPLEYERDFHDNWAKSEDLSAIDVHLTNSSPTSPELRFIHSRFPDLKGKRVLDLGCGLGEASVAFALKGAEVTAIDVSPEMLKFAERLAERYGVRITTNSIAAEYFSVVEYGTFDLIYAGNLFHHINLDAVLPKLADALTADGVLVSWDPVAYNPIINIYRIWASGVRTYDERPFRLSDIKKFNRSFGQVEVRWTWLTTLVLFPLLFFSCWKSPSSVRYWKRVIVEGPKWSWLYWPLELIDRGVLRLFPFLGVLCWNVTLICRYPRRQAD